MKAAEPFYTEKLCILPRVTALVYCDCRDGMMTFLAYFSRIIALNRIKAIPMSRKHLNAYFDTVPTTSGIK